MSETNVAKILDAKELSPTQAADVGGGGCTANDLVAITGSLTQAYDNLVDFASHVIERVAGD